MLEVGERLEFPRPRRDQSFNATVLFDGSIKTENGQIWASPSRAAMSAAKVPSYDGWHAWRVPRLRGVRLDQLRQRLIAEAVEPSATLENLEESQVSSRDETSVK